MDWFLYDNGLRHERVKDYRVNNILHSVTIFSVFKRKEYD